MCNLMRSLICSFMCSSLDLVVEQHQNKNRETEHTNVVFASLHADHLHSWVLNGRCAIALESLHRLVGNPLAVNGQGGNVLALVGQQHLVTHIHLVRVCVKHYRQPKQ